MSNVSQQQYREILVSLTQGVLTITFNRPHKKNAMNLALVKEVMAVFSDIADDTSVRAVVICGSEGNFCAGGDISDMYSDAGSEQDKQQAIWNFNRSFGRMVAQVNQAPQVVITLLEGAVLGGGFGLVCVSDIAIAHQSAVFAMPETGLGVVPAQIAVLVQHRAKPWALCILFASHKKHCKLSSMRYSNKCSAVRQRPMPIPKH